MELSDVTLFLSSPLTSERHRGLLPNQNGGSSFLIKLAFIHHCMITAVMVPATNCLRQPSHAKARVRVQLLSPGKGKSREAEDIMPCRKRQ